MDLGPEHVVLYIVHGDGIYRPQAECTGARTRIQGSAPGVYSHPTGSKNMAEHIVVATASKCGESHICWTGTSLCKRSTLCLASSRISCATLKSGSPSPFHMCTAMLEP